MDTCTIPFNKEIGESISPDITNFLLNTFPDVKVVDVNKFQKKFACEPSIVSIFMVTDGGSFHAHKWWTLNGTYMTHTPFPNMTFGEYSKAYQSVMNM